MTDGTRDVRPLIGLTVGDPAGIGPEIVVQALQDPASQAAVRGVVYADRCVLEATLELLGLDLALHAVDDPAAGVFTPGIVDFVDPGTLDSAPPFGQISAAGGRAGLACLETAIRDALDGRLTGLATAPLNKESLQAARAPWIDHTAVLKELAAHREPMTLFMVRGLRIFFLTRHISFRQIPDAITGEGILAALPLCDLYLRQLGLEAPTVAVAGLNPHGGEQGLFGTDEMDVIRPACETARGRGWRVAGPVPADSVFHQCLEGKYDGVLSLYHDQGHIAAKTLDFHGTVSLTMGLRFLRTSVDHGTAFDIAGRGIADARGMVAAIDAAGRHAAQVMARIELEPVT